VAGPATAATEPPPAEPATPARRDIATPAAAPRSSAASPSTAPAGESAPVTTPAWAVQLGAFSTRDKAEGLVSDLRRRGYAAFVLEYRAGGKLLHRVRVGPEQDRARADAIAERLRKDGYQPVVAPHP
jgi:DedD protein